ncbi:MAG: hypothetical protein R3C45_05055 [Phycisphaerales bacterium]
MKRFTQMLPMLVMGLLVAVTYVTPAMAQDEGQAPPRAERGDRGDRRARPDWNNMTDEQREQMRARFAERFEEMRKQQAERMREDLELSEDEYAAIQPMVENVQRLSMESMAAGLAAGAVAGRTGWARRLRGRRVNRETWGVRHHRRVRRSTTRRPLRETSILSDVQQMTFDEQNRRCAVWRAWRCKMRCVGT